MADADRVRLQVGEEEILLPLLRGSGGERAIDISGLHDRTGLITCDPDLSSTGACRSAITCIDHEGGVLRYRGVGIEDIVGSCDLIETAMLLIDGRLPAPAEKEGFARQVLANQLLHDELRHHFQGFPQGASPIAILSAVISSMACYHRQLYEETGEGGFREAACRLLGSIGTVAAQAYCLSQGRPVNHPSLAKGLTRNFLEMMFSLPYQPYQPPEPVLTAFESFLVLYADHGQNSSTATVRMVASTGANLFASVGAGILSLWGPRMGGTNRAALTMLLSLAADHRDVDGFLREIKRNHRLERLAGFGHTPFRHHDPRTPLMRRVLATMLADLGQESPLFDLARRLEEVVVEDPWFRDRGMVPSPDLYSGVLLHLVGVPLEMFQVLFAMARMAGWIANWQEERQGGMAIKRPRQLYEGSEGGYFIPLDKR